MKTILKRPKAFERKMLLPKGTKRATVVSTFMPSSSDQIAVRLYITKGYEWGTRPILDTESGPSVIRRQLLPKGMALQPLGELEENEFYDLNGGRLPLEGSITLGVMVGNQVSQFYFGVVASMAVPVILGNSWTDHKTKHISTAEQTVTQISGDVVPIIRGLRNTPKPTPNRDAVCACPRGYGARLTLVRGVHIKPGTLVHVPVTGAFEGHGLITPRAALHLRLGVQVAQGPAHFIAGRTQLAQIMNPTQNMVRLPKGMAVGHVTAYDGVTKEVTPEEFKRLEEEARKASAQVPIKGPPPGQPEIDLGNVPEKLREKLRSVIDRYKELWDGSLGLIKETHHRIELRTGATPVRQHPYKARRRTRQIEAEQVELMRSMGVIEPSTGEWASPVVIVPTPGGSPRFCIEYRKLNDQTVTDAYPIPRMHECLDCLGDARVFSTLDCHAGYWHLPVAKWDRPLTALTCHHGTWQCRRLPFGQCNAL